MNNQTYFYQFLESLFKELAFVARELEPFFVLHHQTDFSESIIKQATQKKATYSDENNAYFLEFISLESIEDELEGEGLWFNELIEVNVLGGSYKT
ncbi:hypothetical protein [Sporosarcina limicola]|uniref:Uncharacterized protein n=1 Tax=Sporosarcina limicola TaxID=34101 RepID=A0A927R353_9BACL|nr:hypothetical protein [Sporosarcina limicola]MBE1554686.1 hypothetical protein [Sporosarcina limicola]